MLGHTATTSACQSKLAGYMPGDAFARYNEEYHSKIVAKHPELTNPEISKIISEEWSRLCDEAKNEWKKTVENEPQHDQQNSKSSYQPTSSAAQQDRETSDSKSEAVQSTSLREPTSMNSTHTGPAKLVRPVLPVPKTPTIAQSPERHRMPSLHELKLTSPDHVRKRSYDYHVSPNSATYHHMAPRYPPDRYIPPPGPELKRRRTTNGGVYAPISTHPAPGPQYALISPYRDSFGRPMPVPVPLESPRYSSPPSATGPRPHRPSLAQQQYAPQDNAKPAPISLPSDQSRSMEAVVMSFPFLQKIKALGNIAPPLKMPEPHSPRPKGRIRGPVIAIEGDNEMAVAKTVSCMHDALIRDSNLNVQIAPGPTLALSQPAQISDYLNLITTWHRKNREIIEFITSPPKQKPSTSRLDEDERAPSPKDTSRPANANVADVRESLAQPGSTATPTPVLLLHRFHLHASNIAASLIPVSDAYPPVDHWQWMATLWRGIVGPDLTIFLKDSTAEELRNSGASGDVEVQEGIRCVVVRRDQEAPEGRVLEKTMRRLVFEIEEFVRAKRAVGGEDVGAGTAGDVKTKH